MPENQEYKESLCKSCANCDEVKLINRANMKEGSVTQSGYQMSYSSINFDIVDYCKSYKRLATSIVLICPDYEKKDNDS